MANETQTPDGLCALESQKYVYHGLVSIYVKAAYVSHMGGEVTFGSTSGDSQRTILLCVCMF